MTIVQGFSIVICTHNGEERILPTLEAILKLKSSIPYEVIVVNNASLDETPLIVSDFLKSNSTTVKGKLVTQPTPGLMYARKKGVEEAIYSHIVFCDDDNWLKEDYLEKAAIFFSENHRVGALGGKGIPIFEEQKPEWFDKYAHSFAVGSQDWHLGNPGISLGYLYGAGIIFKKEILETIFRSGIKLALIGRKNNQLVSGDDVELCYLVQLQGFELAYEKKMEFYHWMPKERMRWNNYLSLKEGITKSSALLYSYQFVSRMPSANLSGYFFSLVGMLINNGLILIKHRVIGMPNNRESEVSMLVLKVKFETFFRDFFRSIRHFKQLKKHF